MALKLFLIFLIILLNFSREDINRGNVRKFEELKNVHDVTGIIKAFFQELKKPLIPWKIARVKKI